MHITLKTTTGRTTSVEFPAGSTVRTVKESLKEEYDLATLRLCHNGKILDDNKLIDEFEEGVSLFIAGKKATIPKVTSTISPSQDLTPAPAQSTAAPAPPAPSAEVTATLSTTEPAATPQNTVAPQNTNTQESNSENIDTVMSMGFDDRELVSLALRAAYNDVSRAVDYLFSGVSRTKLQELANDAAPQAQRQVQRQAPSAPQPAAQGSSALRSALEAIPQFDTIRQTVQNHPETLQHVMQQLQQNYPDVFSLVQQNPAEFSAIMNGNARTSQQTVALTQDDVQAIERLVGLGGGQWDAQSAALVYVYCNRNEEIAANILFDNNGIPPQLAQAMMGNMEEAGEEDVDDDADE